MYIVDNVVYTITPPCRQHDIRNVFGTVYIEHTLCIHVIRQIDIDTRKAKGEHHHASAAPSRHSGVHKGGFSKWGFSNLCAIVIL